MRIELWRGLGNPLELACALRASIQKQGSVCHIEGIATDSREVQKGDLFVCLQGEYTAGDAFVKEALCRGAGGVLSERFDSSLSGDFWHFLTPSVPQSLLYAAAERRNRSAAKVVAVTGSAGKTTVKDAISEMLGSVAHSKGNFNSTVGMPLSVLSFPEEKYYVVELGINHVGEMEDMARALRPDIAVITNAGSAHIGLFGSYESLLVEKLKIGQHLAENGTLILPKTLPVPICLAPVGRCFTIGEEGADFCAENIVNTKSFVRCDLRTPQRVITNLTWPIPGRVGVSVLSLVGAVGELLSMSDDEIRAGLLRASLTTPRMKQIQIGERLLIDDTYNASPEAVMAAFEILRIVAAGRPRFAVLGDILELGEFSASVHEALGVFVAGERPDGLFTYGTESARVAQSARLAGMPKECVQHFSLGAQPALFEALCRQLPENAVVLCKGSHKMALDGVIYALKERL